MLGVGVALRLVSFALVTSSSAAIFEAFMDTASPISRLAKANRMTLGSLKLAGA